MFTSFEAAKIECHITNPSNIVAMNSGISRQTFDRAEKEISDWKGYEKTPLFSLPGLASKLDVGEIYYKHEGPRFGLGRFKSLGGAYAVLRVLHRQLTASEEGVVNLCDIRNGTYSEKTKSLTVISATDGNHGRSVAWGAARFGAKCRIYIHAEVSEYRAKVMRDLGAEVIRVDGDYDATVARTRADAKKYGWLIVSDTSWPGYTQAPIDVMAGYGVMAREIIRDISEPPTHVFLQGGVGGLAASIAAVFNQEWGYDAPRVVIVEPELAACLFVSAKANKPTVFEIQQETIMAGLSCGEPSMLAWSILTETTSAFMTIPESVVAPTVRMLAKAKTNDPVIEAGESGVAGLCGLISASLQPALRQDLELGRDSRVMLIGSEGVTDPSIFDAIMADSD